MDEVAKLGEEIVQVARLAAEHKDEDLRLFLARLARRYRRPMPELSAELGRILETATHEPARGTDRRMDLGARPVEDSLPMLRPVGGRMDLVSPVLAESVFASLEQLVSEWRQADALAARGLRPVSSAIFTGPPGVGKTFTAQWLSNQLDLPLLSLDLTAVMSSRLGQSGANLRSVLDYARSAPSLLFLDEVDSIAKRRADDADVGELKRLVTIMLQELDDWPSTSLLIAATNHAELIDPALWRRFDLRIEFPMPEEAEVAAAIERYLGDEIEQVRPFLPAMEKLLASSSFSDIERAMSRVRKHLVLGGGDAAASVEGLVKGARDGLTRAERIAIATDLQRSSPMSQHQISRLMNVSRDTLRKHGRDLGGTSDG